MTVEIIIGLALVYPLIGLIVLTQAAEALDREANKQLKRLEKDQLQAERYREQGIALEGKWKDLDKQREEIQRANISAKALVLLAWPFFLQ